MTGACTRQHIIYTKDILRHERILWLHTLGHRSPCISSCRCKRLLARERCCTFKHISSFMIGFQESKLHTCDSCWHSDFYCIVGRIDTSKLDGTGRCTNPRSICLITKDTRPVCHTQIKLLQVRTLLQKRIVVLIGLLTGLQ